MADTQDKETVSQAFALFVEGLLRRLRSELSDFHRSSSRFEFMKQDRYNGTPPTALMTNTKAICLTCVY